MITGEKIKIDRINAKYNFFDFKRTLFSFDINKNNITEGNTENY